MATKYHINPRFRAYGKARIDVTQRAKNEQEWQNQWRDPLHKFPFSPGSGWRFCFEYKVDDYAAEVGFFIDVLGFPVRAFSPSYAQFTSPDGEICFSVLATGEGEESTPPDSIRLYLNVDNLSQASSELVSRGIAYEAITGEGKAGGGLQAGYFRSPHGVCIELWSESGIETESIDDEEDESLYDEETDRLIDDLLGLSGDNNQSDEEIEYEPIRSADQDEDEFAEDAGSPSLVEQDASFDTIQADPLPDKAEKPTPRTVNPGIAWSAERQTLLPSPSRRRTTDPVHRKGMSPWPASNDQKNAELTYQQIDEELPEDEL